MAGAVRVYKKEPLKLSSDGRIDSLVVIGQRGQLGAVLQHSILFVSLNV